MAEQITNYQCPACTGPLHYSESLGKLKCDYCGTEYEVAEIEAMYAKKEEKSVEAQKKAEKATAGKGGRRGLGYFGYQRRLGQGCSRHEKLQLSLLRRGADLR